MRTELLNCDVCGKELFKTVNHELNYLSDILRVTVGRPETKEGYYDTQYLDVCPDCKIETEKKILALFPKCAPAKIRLWNENLRKRLFNENLRNSFPAPTPDPTVSESK